MIGKTLGKYRIIEHLGHGGMAEVYKAYQPGLDRYVAIKVLHGFLADEEDFLNRFQREAKVVASLRHPNIVQVYDFDYDEKDDVYYMVMEFIEGTTLKSHLQELTKAGELLPIEEAIRVTLAVASALDYAHQHGMVHRDIKPGNIMFGPDRQPILMDFGIAKIVSVTGLTASGAMVGTPAYMSPEQGMGHAGDERSDIYSLGVVLYQLLTGRLPFDADTPLGIVLKHINEPLTLPSTMGVDCPTGLDQVLLKVLAKNPEDRYQTVQHLMLDLKRAAAGEELEPVSSEIMMTPLIPEVTRPNRTAPTTVSDSERGTLPGALPTHTPLPTPQAWAAGRWVWLAIAAVFVLALGVAGGLGVGSQFGRLFASRQTPGTLPFTSTAGQAPTDAPDVEATRFVQTVEAFLATFGVTPTPWPTSTDTPLPSPSPTADCPYDVQLVQDYSVRPQPLPPGSSFVKRWRISNPGPCLWSTPVELAFVAGNRMGAPEFISVDPLALQATTDLELPMDAPAAEGTYTATWQLRERGGQTFGAPLEVRIRVAQPPTPRPTATPTPTPTLSMTQAAPVPAPHIDAVGVSEWTSEGQGTWTATVYVAAGGGDGTYRFYRDVISPANEFFAPAGRPYLGMLSNVTWAYCQPIRISFWVTSAGMTAHTDEPIPFPDPSRCQ